MQAASEQRDIPQATDVEYFSLNPPPPSLESYKKLARAFVADHVHSHRNVVLVTSGGTTVPLENQTVRFIDNFSAGTRGATSAEYFIQAGYAVIFLHRQFSLLPFSRHYSHSTNCFLDYMTENRDGQVVVSAEYQQKMLDVLRKYNAAKKGNQLLLLPFTTITEYLWALKEVSTIMKRLGSTSLFYLAAAVSDFFLPKDRLSEHKIQSGAANGRGQSHASSRQGSKLMIDLDPVPKFLKHLVDGWAPEGMIVSFKLETDSSLLVSKAQQSLEKYSHHLVIGNLLSTRKHEVVFIAPNTPEHWIRVPLHRRVPSRTQSAAGPKLFAEHQKKNTEERQIVNGEPEIEIESLIVPEVIKMHQRFIKLSQDYHEEDEQDMLAKALAWADTEGSD